MERETPTQTQPALHAHSPSELKSILAAVRGGVPFVVWRDGQRQQHIVTLSAERRLTVGRRATNDIVLSDDEQVSRVHAEFEPTAEDWALVDGGLSSNGTFVNDERVSGRRRLCDGDEIRFGRTLLEYRRPAAGSTLPTSQAHPSMYLSEMQRAILVALARPYKLGGALAVSASNMQIAEEVHLSLDAVKGHLTVLYRRFEIAHLARNQKRERLVECAFRLGLVSELEL
jgi:hypothetical protein